MSSVQSVRRAFEILEALAVSPAGLSDIARRVDLPKSTVARLLATLEEAGAVERMPDGLTYRVGPALRGLAASIDASWGIVDLARPTLARLAAITNETAGFAVAEGHQVNYVAQVDTERNVQVRDWSGELVPMHLVPSGQAILAHWPQAAVEEYVSGGLEPATHRSITDAAQLAGRLEEIRRDGHAWVFGEFVEAINSVGAAIVGDSGDVLGAIHIHGPAYRFPGDGDEGRIGELVTDAARRLAAAANRLVH